MKKPIQKRDTWLLDTMIMHDSTFVSELIQIKIKRYKSEKKWYGIKEAGKKDEHYHAFVSVLMQIQTDTTRIGVDTNAKWCSAFTSTLVLM